MAANGAAAFTTAGGVGIVAATAATVSFEHVRDVARAAGETELAAWLLPISVDGSIAAAVAVILADSRAGRRPAVLTWLMLALGLLASLAANVASAEPTVTARLVAAWPPVALALGIEVLAGLVRSSRADTRTAEPTTQVTAAKLPDGLPAGTPPAGPAAAMAPARPVGGRAAAEGTAAGLVRQHAPADDADAIRRIRRLDAESESGEASRHEIQQELGCGGSRAARLARLARLQTSTATVVLRPTEV